VATIGEKVRKRWTFVSTSLALAVCGAAVLAADDAVLSQELVSVLSAQGMSCGSIVKIRTQSERDYLVACQDGSNYQITANAQGVLEPHPLGKKIH
jgi:hypothetical protein